MPLSWNEIRDRAIAFSKNWQYAASESADKQPFWDAFFAVFGRPRRRFAAYEVPIKKRDGGTGKIDGLWRGTLLIEHKSRGKSLDDAYKQARAYIDELEDKDIPRYVLVSDFARFCLYDLQEGNKHEFLLEDLHKSIKHFGFMAGYETKPVRPQDPVNIRGWHR